MTKTLTCTKAIIPVAGFGTRRLPLTKAIEKCMVPIGNRPMIDFVVQDCIKAGITDIIFVVGEDFSQLKRYYSPHPLLEKHLEAKGKKEALAEIRALNESARFHYVVQDRNQPYGTTIPLYLARNFIQEGEQFAVIYGDQFFYRADGSSELASMLGQMAENSSTAGMLAVEVPMSETANYGIVATKDHNGTAVFDRIVDYPQPHEAPSNLNNGSFFVFNSAIFPYIAANAEKVTTGEHFITEAINEFVAAGNDLAVIKAEGEYMDCGSVKGWLKANNSVLGE